MCASKSNKISARSWDALDVPFDELLIQPTASPLPMAVDSLSRRAEKSIAKKESFRPFAQVVWR
jgi:hypothetical protein